MSIASEIEDGVTELLSGNETACKIGEIFYSGLKNFASGEVLEMQDGGNAFNKSETIRFLFGAVGDTSTITIGGQLCYATLRGVKPAPKDETVVIAGQNYRILNVDAQTSIVVLTLKNIR